MAVRQEGPLTVRRLLAAAAGALVIAVAAPAGAQACSIGGDFAKAVAPADGATILQAGGALPVRVGFTAGYTTVQLSVARLSTSNPPALDRILPPEVGTVVETVPLAWDAAAGLWTGSANTSAWASTPGEYLYAITGTLTLPPPPPRVDGSINSCDDIRTIVQDGRWSHRLTVVGASAVTAKAGKARDGRTKVSGRVATAFTGKVKLTVKCPGKRARTTFVPTEAGRWNRTVAADRGCSVAAAVSARPGWAASAASVTVA
jgi:hypothetical protein